MQLDVNSSAMLIDEITSTLEHIATDFNARLADLEALAEAQGTAQKSPVQRKARAKPVEVAA